MPKRKIEKIDPILEDQKWDNKMGYAYSCGEWKYYITRDCYVDVVLYYGAKRPATLIRNIGAKLIYIHSCGIKMYAVPGRDEVYLLDETRLGLMTRDNAEKIVKKIGLFTLPVINNSTINN